jgi:RHS repeat-associated protein
LVTDYGYDQVGNLLTAADSDSALTMAYDLANRLLSSSTAGSPQQPSVSIAYTYDKVGNRKTMTDPTGATAYQYDDMNRLLSLTDPSTQAITFAYDALHRRTDTVFPNGTTTQFAYDAADQLTSLIHQLGATPFSSFNYTYNQVGNRTAIEAARTAISVTNNLTYTYDPLDRLVQATRPLTGLSDETFTYDPVGNRLRRDGQATNAVFDNANQTLDDAEFTYAYDANGNQTEKQRKATGARTQYTYDAENRLVQVQELPSGGGPATKTATYRYDALGRRIEKNVDGVLTRFVYDQEDILLEFDAANTMVARYTHGGGIDEPLVMTRSGQRFFYHANELGSITEISDAVGAVVQAYVYDSFGKIQASRVPLASFANFYTYTGRELDAETGLYFYRARSYEPGVGRFLQEDLLEGTLLFPGSLNLYPYVVNDPINLVDPYGLYFLYHFAVVTGWLIENAGAIGTNLVVGTIASLIANGLTNASSESGQNQGSQNQQGGQTINCQPGATCQICNGGTCNYFPSPQDNSKGSGSGSSDSGGSDSGAHCPPSPDSPPNDKPQPSPPSGGGPSPDLSDLGYE